MKAYTLSVVIDLPREKVIELFDNPDNMMKWQNGLKRFEHLSGEPGQPGAKSRLTYENKGRSFDLFETITERNLPDEFNGTYEWDTGMNTLRNRFIEEGPEKTRWESTCEYKFSGFMLKAMGWLAPGMFRKQNLKYMENFKAFAETGKDIRDED